jgi:hypothetical protein
VLLSIRSPYFESPLPRFWISVIMGGGKVIKEGYLIKSPPLGGKGVKNWHKRFFCYRTTKMLEYYKVESDVGQKPKGFINLEDCVAINAGLVHKKYKHVFSIELKDRTYYLVASCRAEMQDWVDLLCASVFGGKDGSESPSTSAGISFKERFRSNSESSSAENMFLASSVHKSVKQQLKADSVQIEAGTKLSDAFSMKGLKTGSVTLPRSFSSSAAETEGISRHSSTSTPSSSAGIPVEQARSLPMPLPTDERPAVNPLYNTPSGASPFHSQLAPPSPRTLSNPSANPLYNTPRVAASVDHTYKTPSSLPANAMYNTPARRPSGSPPHGSQPQLPPRTPPQSAPMTYNTPNPQAVHGGPQLERKTSVKSHRSALLTGHLGGSVDQESSSPHGSPQPVPRQRKTSTEQTSRHNSKSEGDTISDVSFTPDTPPSLPPRTDRMSEPDVFPSSESSPSPPPVDRNSKPDLEPPPIDRSTKPPVVGAVSDTTLQTQDPTAADESSDEEEDEDTAEEFGEVPQLAEDTLHYVRLMNLAKSGQKGPPPVPLPRTSSLPNYSSQYTEVNKDKKSELHELISTGSVKEPLHEAEYEEEEEEEGEECVQDVRAEDQVHYMNLTRGGTPNEETDPQYYLVMKHEGEGKPKEDGYVTFVNERSEEQMSELTVENPYSVVTH